MATITKVKRLLRGDIRVHTAAFEAMRRLKVARARRRERAQLAELNSAPARLREEFARMSAVELLAHFQSRVTPQFFPGFNSVSRTAELQRTQFQEETAQLVEDANKIAEQHCWPLLGFGDKCFGLSEIDWNRDPLSGLDWPLDYHAGIELIRNDGSDARVVWELNRLGHFITLGRAYTLTHDERFSAEFFAQLDSWRAQNPVARGVNWSCAMEVALRAMNLLTAFHLFRKSAQMNEDRLAELLMTFDQHGAHIRRNLEYSHIATSNHYIADVVGLLWMGVMLPELEAASEWREFGLRELLNEMQKQVLPDGADFEASTGYHRLTLELFLYSFLLCRVNDINIEEEYWNKLRAMIDYTRAYLRPDGRAPLIGDSDSGHVLPIVKRAGDDHAYVLALGAAVFQEPRFKLSNAVMPEELLWTLGEQGVRDYEALPEGEIQDSQGFPDAGIYILRHEEIYLAFNCSDSGIKGRGSHGHNDALSIEVSACGVPFIVDPGTYVYTADLHKRNLFRSTAYHSTVEVDGVEQNSISEDSPFVIGNEANPRVLRWKTGSETDEVIAEHYGYLRLSEPVKHLRAIKFDKLARYWIVSDVLHGRGEHIFRFNFVFDPNVETVKRADGVVQAYDKMKPSSLFLAVLDRDERPDLVPIWVSRDYGARSRAVTACWSINARAPLVVRWALVPIREHEDGASRLELVEHLRREVTQGEIRFGVLGNSESASSATD